MNALNAPLSLRLPARTAKKLASQGIETVADLLLLAPRRYYHWGALTPMHMLHQGEDVTILAEVVSATLVANRSRGGVRLEVLITDGTQMMTAIFFAANEYKLTPHRRLLTPGASFLFAGKVGAYRGRLQLTHPSFEGADGGIDEAEERSARPIPIYPSQAGLSSWVLARAIGMILDGLDDSDIADILPDEVRVRYNIPARAQTLRALHRPTTDEDYQRARRAMAWEEALTLQTVLAMRRSGAQSLRAPSSPPDSLLVREFISRLPFTATMAQRSAIDEISADLAGEHPMQRLLQGDVGSGKTVVALAALLQVLAAGHQGALLAPTEVLAVQHIVSMRDLVAGLDVEGMPIDIRLLTGSTPPQARREILTAAQTGAPLIIVGTHALIQDSVRFADLGLVVVDEQHRFGVAQRDALRVTGDLTSAHQLVMTATPIPRTIAMTVFGDLEETRMLGLPPGRTPVATYLVDAANPVWMERLWQRAREEIDEGGRVYVVCPRIDDSDEVEDAESGARPPLASVEWVAGSLRTLPALTAIAVATLTGRSSVEEKNSVMEGFSSGHTPLLVATTVIEVGVDVPEATMMIIIDAQQFGISQLHQLRGRVGRSDRPSVCMAVHRTGLTPESMQRLEAFAATTDGFELAEKDMEIRKEGDVLGSDQSGRASHLHFLSVRRDGALIEEARREARCIVEGDPSLGKHPGLAEAIRRMPDAGLDWISRS